MSSEVTKHALLGLLQAHIGRDRGIGAQAIAGLLHCNKRHVRDLVTALRMDGTAVCGHPSTGYFVAATGEEIERTCRFLRDRAMTSLVLESRLSKKTLAELLGQLRLPT